MVEKIEVSCPFCDADYVIRHDLIRPYEMSFCSFCGEDIKGEDSIEIDDLYPQDDDYDDDDW